MPRKLELDVTNSLTTAGTPSMSILPADHYKFDVSKDTYRIEIPLEGSYHELAPEFFAENDGTFKVFDKENNILRISEITKVLFAVNKYPDLKDNQLFTPIFVKINEDTLEIIAKLIQIGE